MNAPVTTDLTERALSPAVRGFDFVPTSFVEAREFAEFLAGSDLLPKDFRDKPANVLIAIGMGTDLGLKPMQALQNIAVINGRPTMWGDAVLAVVRGSGLLVDIDEGFRRDKVENDKSAEDGWTAYCTVQRKGERALERTFSVKEAKAANLWGKQGPWKQYPRRMLQMRARSFALRDGFADLLRGIVPREEAMDMPSPDGTTIIEGAAQPSSAATAGELNAALLGTAAPASTKTKEPPKPTLEELLGRIAEADSIDELMEIDLAGQHLKGKARDDLRAAVQQTHDVLVERDGQAASGGEQEGDQ